MLKTENEEAFTEIMYDDTTAKTQDVHNQTTTNTSNFKVKVKRRVFDTRQKIFSHKYTDTGDDFNEAAKTWDKQEKMFQIKLVEEEIDANILELTR